MPICCPPLVYFYGERERLVFVGSLNLIGCLYGSEKSDWLFIWIQKIRLVVNINDQTNWSLRLNLLYQTRL